jgi:hypothetical protein
MHRSERWGALSGSRGQLVTSGSACDATDCAVYALHAVDSNWPAPGTRILHSIRTSPAVINDETVVRSWVPGEELVS